MEISHEYLAVLVKRSQLNDSNAFAELYSLTYQKVYNYCRHYLKDDYSAQDAVQEIYITAYKNINKIKDPTLFIAWINQISFHTCFDISRDRQGDESPYDSEILEEISDSKLSNNPEASVFSKDERERLIKSIKSLSPTEQELITLRYYKGMKIDEIVNVTDYSKSTVKRHLQAALDDLKKLMKG